MHARALLLATLAVGGTPLGAGDVKLEAVVDFVRGDTLFVDGQRLVLGAGTRYKGSRPSGAGEVPPGSWAKGKGPRDANGAILAAEVELRAANPDESHEAELKAASDQAEEAWVSKGMMYMPAGDGKVAKIGDLVTKGPYVVRARKIMDKLRPPYVKSSDLRVHIVKTEEWNASAMANGAVWVYTGLMDDFDDDELAIVLGHELAHYTNEHSRRNAGKSSLGQILGAGAAVAGAALGGTAGQMAQLGGQLGASALLSGYSRSFEDQADRVGLRYVYEAGYDVNKGPQLWEKFRTKYGETDQVSNFFTGDHSRPTDRIKNIQNQIAWNYAG